MVHCEDEFPRLEVEGDCDLPRQRRHEALHILTVDQLLQRALLGHHQGLAGPQQRLPARCMMYDGYRGPWCHFSHDVIEEVMDLVRGPEQVLVRQRGELLRHQLQVVSRVLHLLQLPRQVVPGIENNLHYMETIENLEE